MAFPGTSSTALQISVVSVQKFNLSHTEFIRIINHLSASCTKKILCNMQKEEEKKKLKLEKENYDSGDFNTD